MTQPLIPPTLAATNFLTMISPNSVSVVFGHSQAAITGYDGQGFTDMTAIPAWHATMLMSPTAANSLKVALEKALMDYREKFGPYAEDVVVVQKIITGRPDDLSVPASPQ